MRLILDGPVEHMVWAMRLAEANVAVIGKLSENGGGFGYWSSLTPRLSAHIRRTKTGASVKFWVNDNAPR